MPQWTIDAPTSLDFSEVTNLKIRLLAGSVAVLATDNAPSLDVTSISGRPLQVTQEGGTLTISYENLNWEGLLDWLKPQRHSAVMTVTVPSKCPTQLGVVSATAVVSGITARTSVKSVSGGITLDGVTGDVDAQTVSGALEAQSVGGRVGFKSVSGELVLAGGTLDRLDANTVSGAVTADIDLEQSGGMQVATVSGDVALRLPAQAGTQVNLHSTSGKVHSEFEGLRASRAPASHSVSGTLGDGSGHVSVTTLSGRITLLRRNQRNATAQDHE
jgi:Putative adhesin